MVSTEASALAEIERLENRLARMDPQLRGSPLGLLIEAQIAELQALAIRLKSESDGK